MVEVAPFVFVDAVTVLPKKLPKNFAPTDAPFAIGATGIAHNKASVPSSAPTILGSLFD